MMAIFMQTKMSYLIVSPPRRPIFMRFDYYNFDRHWRPQQINHLIMGQGCRGNFADLHQSAALSQAGLPCEAMGLHISYNGVIVEMEAQLAQAITT